MPEETEDVYVQTFIVRMKMPDGEKRAGKFMGLALFGPDEFSEITKEFDTLEELFVEDEQCIIMGQPIHIEQAISGEEKTDIVKMVREELRRDHHSELKEDKTNE